VASSRTVKATGERQIQGTRWYRFDQSYPIPDYCEPEALQAKFETPVLTLTMPKKPTSQSQEKGAVAEPKLDQKPQDTTTAPQSTTTTKVEEPIQGKKSDSPQPTTTLEDRPSQTPSQPIKDRKGQEEAVERVGPSGEPQMGEKELEAKPTPTRAASMHADEKIQKGQQEIESKPTPTRTTTMRKDEKIQKGQEIESKPTPTVPTKMVTDEKPQKGVEEFEPRPTPATLTKVRTAEKYQKGQEFEPRATPAMLTKVKTAEKSQKDQEDFEPKPKPTPTMPNKDKTDEKPQKGQEEFEPKATSAIEPNIKTDEQPPKGQEEDKPKPDTTNVTRKPTVKEQLEEKKTEETTDEYSEESSDDDSEETSDGDSEETSDEDEEKERITKEVKEEPSKSRKSVKGKEQADFGEKETKTEQMLDKEAETSGPKVNKDRTSLKKELKSGENAMERVGSVSHVFTKFAEGALNEEEKKLAANIGAAILVIAALGCYVSYRITS